MSNEGDMTRYVAFIGVGGHWCGFTSAANWQTMSHLRADDVATMLPFEAPSSAEFDEVEALSQQAARAAGYAVHV